MARNLTRRAFIVLGVTGAGGVLMAACSSSGSSGQTPSQPTAAPAASNAAAPTAAPAAPAQPTAAPAAQAASSGTTAAIRWQFRGSADDLKGAAAYLNDTFGKTNPNIKVTVEPAPDSRDEKLIASMVAGTAPDVFETWSDNVTQFADRGQVTDVESLVQRDFKSDDLKDFYPWQWHDFSIPLWINNQIQHLRFGLPKYVNVMFLWYNKDAFKEAGVAEPTDTWTHDDYAAAAIKLTTKKGTTVDRWGLEYPVWSWDRYWYKVDAWGGTVVDPNDWTKATFDTDKALAAFEWSRKLMWDDQAMAQQLQLAGGAGQSFSNQDLFASGKLAMVEDGFYPFAMAKSIQKKINWAYQHVPKGPVQRKVLGTTDGFSMWKNSKSPDASWELLKYLSGKDYQANQVKTTGLLPIRFSVLNDWKKICIQTYPELESVNLDVGPKAMEMGYPGNRAFFKQDAEARQIMTPALQKLFVSGGTPVTYLQNIAKQVNQKMQG